MFKKAVIGLLVMQIVLTLFLISRLEPKERIVYINSAFNNSSVTSSKEEIISEQEEAETDTDTDTDTEDVIMVWIPEHGKKYHSDYDCSGMKNPTEVTLEYAESWGYDPCYFCYC